jgi:hypothetical protein
MHFFKTLWGALALFVMLSGGPGGLSAQAQVGYDRFGGDYLRFEVRNGDPEVRQLAAQTLERIAAETKLPARPSGR